jgi:hypothetical protein
MPMPWGSAIALKRMPSRHYPVDRQIHESPTVLEAIRGFLGCKNVADPPLPEPQRI